MLGEEVGDEGDVAGLESVVEGGEEGRVAFLGRGTCTRRQWSRGGSEEGTNRGR